MSTSVILSSLLALGLLGVLGFCIFASGINLGIRVALTLGLLALVGFCIFGFLASYEYPDASRRLPWQLGYGTVAFFCLLITILLWRPRRSQKHHDHEPK
jgi:hypothetical protein